MRIGTVATATGLPAKAIRYYESVGLIQPPRRRANGYRAYDPHEIEDLRFLARARKLGFSLETMAELLRRNRARTGPCRDVKDIAVTQAAEADRKIEELTRLRAVLTQLVAECPGGTTDCCNILAAMADEAPEAKAGADDDPHDPTGDDCCC